MSDNENAMQPGRYRAKATTHKFGKSKAGAEQVWVDFEITSGPHAGKHLGWYGHFTEKTAERTLESLEYCGWTGMDLYELPGLGTKEVELALEFETGNDGREYLKVRWVNKVAGGIKNPLDRGGVAGLEQRLKGMMMQRQQKRAAEKPMRESGDDMDEFGPTNYGDEPPV